MRYNDIGRSVISTSYVDKSEFIMPKKNGTSVDVFKDLNLSLNPSNIESFLSELSLVIETWLLKRDLEKLYFYLYRIDVDEHKIEYLLSLRISDKDKARKIAELMYQRHTQKLN